MKLPFLGFLAIVALSAVSGAAMGMFWRLTVPEGDNGVYLHVGRITPSSWHVNAGAYRGKGE